MNYTGRGDADSFSIRLSLLKLLFSLICLHRLLKYVFSFLIVACKVIIIVMIFIFVVILVFVLVASGFAGALASATHSHRVISIFIIFISLLRFLVLLFVVLLDLL